MTPSRGVAGWGALVIALGLLACESPPEPSLPAPWMRLSEDARARVSLDTSRLEPLGDGRVRVRVRYDLTDRLPLPGGREGSYQSTETTEVTECERETARVMSMALFDSAHQEVGRIGEAQADSVGNPRMIGVGGPPLCAYLRRLKLVPPGA